MRRGVSPVRRGASPVRRGASPVRRGCDDDDCSRSPSPSIPLRKSRGRMQAPSAAAKSESRPRGRTMTRSASRAASRGGSPKAAADNVKIVAAAAAAHYQSLDAKYPDRVRAPSVSRCGYKASSPDSLRRFLVVPVPRETRVSNTTMLDAASGSAAGRQVSIRVLELVSRGGEVLREVVQAVVKAVG